MTGSPTENSPDEAEAALIGVTTTEGNEQEESQTRNVKVRFKQTDEDDDEKNEAEEAGAHRQADSQAPSSHRASTGHHSAASMPTAPLQSPYGYTGYHPSTYGRPAGGHAAGAPPSSPPAYYHDASAMPDPASDSTRVRSRNRGGVSETFPDKLHRVIETLEREQSSEISFFRHGRAFAINQPRRFTEMVIPRFFKQTKMTSFQRQLNLYGFRRITQGTDNGGYYHPYFLKGRPRLCSYIKRVKIKGDARSVRDPDSEPNFYAYPPIRASDAPPTYPGYPPPAAAPPPQLAPPYYDYPYHQPHVPVPLPYTAALGGTPPIPLPYTAAQGATPPLIMYPPPPPQYGHPQAWPLPYYQPQTPPTPASQLPLQSALGSTVNGVSRDDTANTPSAFGDGGGEMPMPPNNAMV